MNVHEVADAVSAVFPEQLRSITYDEIKKEGMLDFDVFPEKTSKEVYDDTLPFMDDIRKALEPFDLQVDIEDAHHDYICFKLTSSVVDEQTGDQNDP